MQHLKTAVLLLISNIPPKKLKKGVIPGLMTIEANAPGRALGYRIATNC